MRLPACPNDPHLEGLEDRWSARWEQEGTYRFDRATHASEVFSIDTPPPTVSGSLHVGHVFSYTQTDIVARYRRMTGKAVFYPIGWDDNGLPTERRVQDYFGVSCDPSLPYDPTSSLRRTSQSATRTPSDPDLAAELRRAVQRPHRRGRNRPSSSCSASSAPRSTGPSTTRRSARWPDGHRSEGSFACSHAAGLPPRSADAVGRRLRTAVAQAELVDKEDPGFYHRLRFERRDGDGPIEIETTRPELAACLCRPRRPPRRRALPGACSVPRS